MKGSEKESRYSGQHVSVFTRRNGLRRNPQALFCCQGTTFTFFFDGRKATMEQEDGLWAHFFPHVPPTEKGLQKGFL
jgi:hypothetical protein